ncbi:MAG: peptidylprolyl isomerase [Alphaproteobacteria bacterium]|nr:peptidylprolyl isomerase [Alphaproteobacteria bacterium]
MLALALLMTLACQQEPPAPEAAAAPPQPADLPPEVPDDDPGAEEERAPDDVERLAARHVLISYVGAVGTPLGVNRDRDEALALAESLRARLAAGEDFAELARTYSDDGSARRGGFLGSAGPGAWVPAFEEAVRGLPVGGLSGVVESHYGFHVIRREPLLEAHVRHVVVQYAGARGVKPQDPAAQRSEAQAEARVEEALAALAAGEPFEDVAKRYSDGPMGKRGGDLGWLVKGDLGPAFDDAVFALEVGERSGVIRSPFGLHVVERVE